MKTNTLIYCVVALCISNLSLAQGGIGIISFKNGITTHIEEEIEVFDSTRHKPIGTLVDHYSGYFIKFSNGDSTKITDYLVLEPSSATRTLPYYDEKEDFIQIGINSGKPAAWIKVADLNRQNSKAIKWIDCFKNVLTGIGLVPNLNWNDYTCLNLRTGASTSDEVLTCVKGHSGDGYWELTPTGKSSGLWLEVTAKRKKYELCTEIWQTYGMDEREPVEQQVLETKKGWIKAIDDRGTFNVWFFYCIA